MASSSSSSSSEFTGLKVDNKSVGGMGDLQERLREHNEYIDLMLTMIPTRFYLSRSLQRLSKQALEEYESDESDEENNAWTRFRKTPAQKEATKFARKIEYAKNLEDGLNPEIQEANSIPFL